ncbi:MAG: ThuA domain-containing protein [Cyclobacteriaceae bacterium]|nr:ThuA domain-containing protein [Cyclobacteriaceae bacterium]MDH5249449.1 ThuA domain-containing protein [Cyclobacteriaceae bacterium]
MRYYCKPIVVSVLLSMLSIGFLSMLKPPGFKAIAILSKASDHGKMMARAIPFLKKMAAENNFTVDITDDTSQLNDINLMQYQVVIQLQQAPFDMSAEQQAALQKFIEQGKGWVGIHAAGLTGRQFISPGVTYWQWFEDFMGGVVYSPHPAFQRGTIIVEDRKHPAMRHLPERFEVADEWYEFDKSPRPNVHVLARADESTYKQNRPMVDHPIIWVNPAFDRMIYIGIGHDASLCDDNNYRVLVRDAIRWAASN